MTAFLECFDKSRVDKIRAEVIQALYWSRLGNLAIGRRELIVDGNSKAVSKFAEWFANPFLVAEFRQTQDAIIVCQFRRIPLICDLLVFATIDSSNFELICDAKSQDPGEMVTATIASTHCSPFNMSKIFSSNFSRQPAMPSDSLSVVVNSMLHVPSMNCWFSLRTHLPWIKCKTPFLPNVFPRARWRETRFRAGLSGSKTVHTFYQDMLLLVPVFCVFCVDLECYHSKLKEREVNVMKANCDWFLGDALKLRLLGSMASHNLKNIVFN